MLYEEKWYQKREKEAILGKFPVEAMVPVPVHVVPVPVQVVLVPPKKTKSVPVPIRAVPVPQCPKCLDCCIFSYLRLKSCTDSIGTLLNA